jgi:hypothetical protein
MTEYPPGPQMRSCVKTCNANWHSRLVVQDHFSVNLVFRFQVGLANVVILESHGAPISTAIRPCPQNACLWILLDDLGTTKNTSVMA